MASLDVFHQDPFTTIQLTAAVDKYPFQPTGLGDLDIFEPDPIRTTALAVEQRQGKLIIVPTTPRGAEGVQRTTEKRQARYFDVPRLMHSDTIYANEIQSIRQFGTESELMQVQVEVARRMNGPTGILRNIEYTWEFHRLAAVQGKLIDADGDVLYDWFDEFGIAPPTPVPFDLAANIEYSLRPIINGIRRTMARKAQGSFTPNTRIYALCGDSFYDEFVNHQDVIRTFVNWSAAADLRDDKQGGAFDAFPFAGVTWMNYRGSDDNVTIKVPNNEVHFFPVGAPGIFRVAYAPGESFEWVNTPGKPTYVIPIFDRDRNSWWKMEAYSYPLHICTRPEVLQKGAA
ncbi:major capsid protein [Paraburkholderia silviterrae]|uniref:Major capsid protein n=1 Tax=Paraburkholderia silviterrae TaxID=2528715 RepID=A0A4R5M9C2_9BURK|nr:major capsid protein [Paraburkholderia silviterrae]TDG23222.1 major capsid protein [Paraburkholderia silviterrae]